MNRTHEYNENNLANNQYNNENHSTKTEPPTVVINNSQNMSMQPQVAAKNKWIALILCALLGVLGAHKFYEGKILFGILYLFTGGLFLLGVVFDFIAILMKPNPYYP